MWYASNTGGLFSDTNSWVVESGDGYNGWLISDEEEVPELIFFI